MTSRFMKRDTTDAAPESADERRSRLALERAMLEEARADIAAGRIVEGDEADACLRAFVDGVPLPIPAFNGRRDR